MIKINTVGIIKSGDDSGYQVKILDDAKNTGGFLILISPCFDDPTSAAFDDWVQDEKALASYVEESNWVIRWCE